MGADASLSAFADYESEISSLIHSAASLTSEAQSTSAPLPSASASLASADAAVAEATSVLQSAALELSSLPAPLRAAAKPRLEASRAALGAARAGLREARSAVKSRGTAEDRGALLGGGVATGMKESGDRILESRRNVAATEGVAEGILSDLASQRATIQRARGNLEGVDGGLQESSAVIAAMNRRALVNRLVVYAVFALVGIGCSWIVYSRLFRK